MDQRPDRLARARHRQPDLHPFASTAGGLRFGRNRLMLSVEAKRRIEFSVRSWAPSRPAVLMFRRLLLLRYILLIPVAGSAIGALLMAGLGVVKMWSGLRSLFAVADGASTASAMIVDVMGAVDAFLFAIVLVIFALAIAFGFILDPGNTSRHPLPKWVQVGDVGDIKRTLLQVIIVYLVVDFVTDLAESGVPLSWQMLVKPLSVIIIAATLRLQTYGAIACRRQS